MKLTKTIGAMLTIALITLFSITNAQAQMQEDRSVDIGITGGLNLAKLNDAAVDNDMKAGLSAGVFSRFYIPNSPMSIQPEILYSQKGASGDDIDANLDYIEIPVLARFAFVNDSDITPNVFFGPYVGFNINAEGTNGNITINAEDYVNKTDAGVMFGADVEFSQFSIGGRYSAGLIEVFDEQDATAKNGVLSIMVGVKF